MIYTVRPISDRTPFAGQHVDSRFTVIWSGCLELLERELDFLDASDLVIEVDVLERGIRMDGRLRADAKAATPAVRVAFESKHGPLTYATDRFRRAYWRRGGMSEDWQHNVYAIALSLEALRKVDRYGVTKRGEQYTGWKAIGSGPATAMPAGMTEREAENVLSHWASKPWVSLNSRQIHRLARAAAHPDRHNGDQSAWDRVEQAAKALQVIA